MYTFFGNNVLEWGFLPSTRVLLVDCNVIVFDLNGLTKSSMGKRNPIIHRHPWFRPLTPPPLVSLVPDHCSGDSASTIAQSRELQKASFPHHSGLSTGAKTVRVRSFSRVSGSKP